MKLFRVEADTNEQLYLVSEDLPGAVQAAQARYRDVAQAGSTGANQEQFPVPEIVDVKLIAEDDEIVLPAPVEEGARLALWISQKGGEYWLHIHGERMADINLGATHGPIVTAALRAAVSQFHKS